IGGIPVESGGFVTFSDNELFFTGTFSGDTTRFKGFGAYQGKAFSFTIAYAPLVPGDGAPFAEYYTHFRPYHGLTRRSLIAWRFFSAVSNSTGFLGQDGSTIFSFGGYNQLRGYDFRQFFGNRIAFSNLELRFPLIDEIHFAFGAVHMLRGFLFFDVGAGWFQGSRFFDPQTGLNINFHGVSLLIDTPTGVGVVPREFECWDSSNNMLGDCRAAYGFGVAWYLGPFEFTWVWARRLENSIVVGIDTDKNGISNSYTRIPDPFFDGSLQTSF